LTINQPKPHASNFNPLIFRNYSANLSFRVEREISLPL
jgi:hypothetical protein